MFSTASLQSALAALEAEAAEVSEIADDLTQGAPALAEQTEGMAKAAADLLADIRKGKADGTYGPRPEWRYKQAYWNSCW